MELPHKPYGTVYGIRHLASGRVYVGITIQRISKRWAYHRWALRNGIHMNPYLQNAWNKHGESAFEFIVFETCDSQEALNSAECQLIKALGGLAYNLKSGGGFGGAPSDESRRKMSLASKGRPKSAETRRRMSEGSKGVKRQQTPEGQARALEARLKVFQRPEYRERRRQAALGRKHTLEARERMRDAQAERYGMTYHLRSPDGTVYTTRYLTRFCDEHGLNYKNIRNVVDGNCKSSQGWTVTVERE